MSSFKSIREYFKLEKEFVVPYYQRGYKWSLLKNMNRNETHLNLLLDDLIGEFDQSRSNGTILPNHEYYLQGVTVKEKENIIELVDGQQRTTSLFILLCVLKNKDQDISSIPLEGKLKYEVRKKADETLQKFILGISEGDDNIQDIFALKEAWSVCNKRIGTIDNLSQFTDFLLDCVKLIYIPLDPKQNEAKVFSMMNQDKADMTKTDLIKSNILREASRQLFGGPESQSENAGMEWQINQQRSKLATEWDNWRKWWEQKKHRDFAGMISIKELPKEPHMSALFPVFWRFFRKDSWPKDEPTNANLFEHFKKIIANPDSNIIGAVEVFENLRLIQTIIQEWYNDVSVYNHLGLLFKASGLSVPEKETKVVSLLQAYCTDKSDFAARIIRKEYCRQILGGSTPEKFIEILANEKENVYHNHYTGIARQLLRMNVTRADMQKHKFDFLLYAEEYFHGDEIENRTIRSLEHIKPQNRSDNKLSVEESEKLQLLTNTIGNLVLLPKGLNSELSNKSFEEKKAIVFSKIITLANRNYGLWLHTIEVFGKNHEWGVKEIEKNRETFVNEFNNFFKPLS